MTDRYWNSARQEWVYPPSPSEMTRARAFIRDCPIHHIDGDPLNNDPANLRVVRTADNPKRTKA